MTDVRPVALSNEDRARLDRTISSMLWAGWADAVGFISELVDERGLRRRLNGSPLHDAVEWTRRVGGRFGANANLPAGTYSDDTQLRLATSRAISARGFDVAAFAKVELTVWPSYALGGGRASKSAASSLARQGTSWSTNFYEGWHSAGGNGVAMRIQPHVWSSPDLRNDSLLLDVIRNGVVTHGHPRALVGAVVHALALAFALEEGRVPAAAEFSSLLDRTQTAVGYFDVDHEIAQYWKPRWEQVAGKPFEEAWTDAVLECRQLFMLAESSSSLEMLVDRLELRDPEVRGSGTATAVAAVVISSMHQSSARETILSVVGLLGTDTDTIGTMVGAIIGAATGEQPPDNVQDRKYMRDEADRLFRVATGRFAASFPYPDPLYWTPPRSQLEVVGNVDGRAAIAGLGKISFVGEVYYANEAQWCWGETEFGPSMLIKRRPELVDLPTGSRPRLGALVHRETTLPRGRQNVAGLAEPAPPTLFDEISAPAEEAMPPKISRPQLRRGQLDDLLALLHRTGFSDEEVGRAVKRVAAEGSADQLATFVKQLRALM